MFNPFRDVFRAGPDSDYVEFSQMEHLPVISVAPVRGPRLNESGTSYSFIEERELMKDKMRTVLRIAAQCNHDKLVIGAFGLGPLFKNPPREVAEMWRSLLYEEFEFIGVFSDVAFAIDSDSFGAKDGDLAKDGKSDFEIFTEELGASKIFPTRY